MSLRTGDLPGIRNRVLRWGPQVEVLAPSALRSEVRRTLAHALQRYAAP